MAKREGMLANISANIPQVEIENYVFLVAGIPKSGKTSLFANLIEEYFKDLNKGLLLAFEKGYQALRVTAQDIEDWAHFADIVDDLIENKDQYPFKYLGIDTADVMWEMAQDKVIAEWNAKNPQKRTNDIGGVGAKGKSDAGFGTGYSLAKAKVRKQLDRLLKAGYGIMIITHSKDKEVEQKDGLKYDQLSVSLSNSARDVFVNMADFIIFLTSEKEKQENGSVKPKRYMYFRSDGYVEAGSRFKNVPERIEYNIKGFIDVFTKAVESEFTSKDEVKEAEQVQRKQKEEKTSKYVEKEKAKISESHDVEELQNVIAEKINNVPDNVAGMIATKFKEVHGTINFKSIDNVEVLQSMINIIKELAG